jgi:hypothetical protein
MVRMEKPDNIEAGKGEQLLLYRLALVVQVLQ